jgi:exosortase
MTPLPGPTWRSIVAAWPLPYRLAWAGVAIVTAAFLYVTAIYWADLEQSTINRLIRNGEIGTLLGAPFKSDNWDRVVVLAGCLWCWAQLMPKLNALPVRPMPIVGLPLLLVGCAALVPVGFCYGQIGARHVLIWMAWGSTVAILAGAILTHFGWPRLSALRFVFFFSIIALPIPGRINSRLQDVLQEITTSLAYWGLKLTGHTVVKEGFVLHLPAGDLGVVEACCGIRSLTSLVAIAAFMAFLKKFSPLRGALLLSLSIPVIILVNGLRVLLTGVLQESVGREWAAGWRHELVGYVMVGLGLALIVGLARVISPPDSPDGEPEATDTQPGRHPSIIVGWLTAFLVTVSLAATAFAWWQPSVGKSALPDGTPAIAGLPKTLGEWTGEDLPIDPELTNALRYNEAIFRRYRNRLGFDMTVWVMYWSTAKAVKGYHHPDQCMPNHGQQIAYKDQRLLKSPSGSTVPITYREFTSPRAGRSRVIYWTQEGRYFWTPDDETAAFHMTYPFRWIERRLGPRAADEFDDRLIVLIGTPVAGDKDGTLANDFAGRLADGLYETCPWAKPK